MENNLFTVTELEILKNEALEWTLKIENKFEILICNLDDGETERRIDFHVPEKEISFFVVINKSDNKIVWHLWSNNEDLLVHLNPVIEICNSCTTNTLTSILDSVSTCLSKLITTGEKSVAKNDSDYDNDEDDEEFVDCDDGNEVLSEEDDDDGYYIDGTMNEENSGTNFLSDKKDENEVDEDDDDDVESYFEGGGNPTAIARLVKDIKNMQKIKGKYGIEGCPKGNNLFVWDVKLTDFPTDSLLGKDIKKYSDKYQQEPVINLEMQFPKDYPFSPPFIRVVKPRFQFLTGHVTVGGSICLQMLTKSGWSPSNDIELILIQVRTEILSDKNARLASARENEVYSQVEAKQAFDRMVQRYGWNK